MNNLWYTLEGEIIKKCSVEEWSEMFEGPLRIVKRTQIGWIRVSTVFMGLDHNFSNEGPPLLFETMIFGGRLNQQLARCSTWEEAETVHREMVQKVWENTWPFNLLLKLWRFLWVR